MAGTETDENNVLNPTGDQAKEVCFLSLPPFLGTDLCLHRKASLQAEVTISHFDIFHPPNSYRKEEIVSFFQKVSIEFQMEYLKRRSTPVQGTGNCE